MSEEKMQEPLREQTRLKGWEMVLGTIICPSEALRDIAQQRPGGDAIGLIFIASIIGYGVDSLLSSGNQFSLFGMVLNTLYELFSFAVFVGLVHGIGRQWYNMGDYEGAFCALAFTSIPFIFFSLISILIIPLGIRSPSMRAQFWTWGPRIDPAMGIFMLILALVVLIWTIILNVIAIREHYDLNSTQAVITCILANVAHGVIFWLLEGIFK